MRVERSNIHSGTGSDSWLMLSSDKEFIALGMVNVTANKIVPR